MKARYYDSNIGRFISEDPIGLEGGDVNLYGYVNNNPINAVDPEGMRWLKGPGNRNYMGLKNSIVHPNLFQEGSQTMELFEYYAPNAWETSKRHDYLLENTFGYKDESENPWHFWPINILTIPYAFGEAFLYNVTESILGTSVANSVFGCKCE